MNTKKKIITIIIGVEAVIIAAAIGFLFYINSDTVKVNRQLELAQRYLLEADYEQAIAAFGVVIDIDPKNEDAYLGLAEAYAAVDDLENAVKTLERASRKIDSEEVLAQLEIHTAEIEAAQRAAEAAQAAAEATAAASASSPEEIAVTPQQDTTAAETSEPESETALKGFIVRGDDWYYYDEMGNLVTGWFEKNSEQYCARADGKLYRDGEHEIDSTKYQFDSWGVCLGEVEDDIYEAFLRGECECYFGEWGGSYTLQQFCKKACETYDHHGFMMHYGTDLYVGYGYYDYEQDGIEELMIDMTDYSEAGCGYIFFIKYNGKNLQVVDYIEQPDRGGSRISVKGIIFSSYTDPYTGIYHGDYYPMMGSGYLANFNYPDASETTSAEFICTVDPSLSYSTDNYWEDSAEFDQRIEKFEKRYVGDYMKLTEIDTSSWF